MKKIYMLFAAIVCLSLTVNAQDLSVSFTDYTDGQVVVGPSGGTFQSNFTITNNGSPLGVGDTIIFAYYVDGTLRSARTFNAGFFSNENDSVRATGSSITRGVGQVTLTFATGAVAGDQVNICAFAYLQGVSGVVASGIDTVNFNGDLTPADNMACFDYEFDGVTGLDENLSALSDRTYISNRQLVIENNNIADFNSQATVNIINLTGQIVQTEELMIQQGNNTIGLNNLPMGIYVVSIQVDSKITTKKVMIQ